MSNTFLLKSGGGNVVNLSNQAHPAAPYQVKKMYDPLEAQHFGSSDVQLKQLNLKLAEQNQHNHILSIENQELRRLLQIAHTKVPEPVAD